MHIDQLDETALYCVLISLEPRAVSRVVKFETLRGIDAPKFDHVPSNHVTVTRNDGSTLAIWFDPTRPELRDAKRAQLPTRREDAATPENVACEPSHAEPNTSLKSAVAAPFEHISALNGLAWR